MRPRPLGAINADIAAEEEVLQLQQTNLVGLGFHRDQLQVTDGLRDQFLANLEAVIAHPASTAGDRADALADKKVTLTQRALALQKLAQNQERIATAQQAVTRMNRTIALLKTELALRQRR
jgi:hypothetical protein